eukprot:6479299-Amphidinium_carterae.1
MFRVFRPRLTSLGLRILIRVAFAFPQVIPASAYEGALPCLGVPAKSFGAVQHHFAFLHHFKSCMI